MFVSGLPSEYQDTGVQNTNMLVTEFPRYWYSDNRDTAVWFTKLLVCRSPGFTFLIFLDIGEQKLVSGLADL
jgi:hypothetical protein